MRSLWAAALPDDQEVSIAQACSRRILTTITLQATLPSICKL
jgi:hypothetical protein